MRKVIVALGLASSLLGKIAYSQDPAPSPQLSSSRKIISSETLSQAPTATPNQTSGPLAPPAGNPFVEPFFAPPGPIATPVDSQSVAVSPPLPVKTERLFTYADFYYAGGQGTLVPPLITQSPAGTTIGVAGAFASPNTTVLYGNQQMMKALRPGFRAGGGFWIDNESRFGVDGNIMGLADQTDKFLTTVSNGGPIVARPVVNGLTNTNIGIPIGNTLPATITSQVDTSYWGADLNFRLNIRRYDIARLDLIAGYRYAQLNDAVNVNASLVQQVTIPAIGNAAPISFSGGIPQQDLFSTKNQFYGGQIGLAGTVRIFDQVTLSGRGTVALGATVSDVFLSGTAAYGGTGLLVQSSNLGRYSSQDFAVMPEVNTKIGFEPTERLRLNVGYTWTYWSLVRRAADQIDLTVLAAARPNYPSATTDYWIQGWTLGAEWRW